MRKAMWILLALSMAATVGALGYRMAERDDWFDLGEARVRGIRPVDSAMVARTLRPYFGTPLGSIDLPSIRRDLEELSLVDSAEVGRSWPQSIAVEVSLARPVAVLADTGGRTAVDAGGNPLPATFVADSLPLIALEAGYARDDLLRLLDYVSSAGTPAGVEGIELGPRGVSFLTGECRVLLGSARLPLRWGLFRSIPRGALLTGRWCTVDMRYRGQAVVRSRREERSG
ncbi:MAG: FtsQ-type POTRA domain-containing protein [Candidatus Fermentibacteraceae bacterium]